MAHEEIALALGIARNTLEKHFEAELSVGAHRRRMEVVVALHAAAKKGNVAAARAYLQLSPKAAVPTADPPTPRAEKPGKKEQANLDAQTAHVGSDWETLLKQPASVQ